MSIGRVLTALLALVFTLSVWGQSPGVHLGDLSWRQAEERYATTPIVVLPFGAGAKEHGPHMPMNADRVVMDHLVNAAVESRDVIVAPPVLHGWFPAFREFPGTEVADPGVFQDYIFHVGMSLAKQGGTTHRVSQHRHRQGDRIANIDSRSRDPCANGCSDTGRKLGRP